MTRPERARPIGFVVTCEHAGHQIPAAYRRLFSGRRDLLLSHHGFDRGARAMARQLARELGAPLFHSQVSRLLVDLNRSPGHHRLHVDVVRGLSPDERELILQRYYEPFRQQAEQAVRRKAARGQRVIHISSHSFTPVLDGKVRQADVGLLYDPARRGEVELCRAWRAALQARLNGLRIRRNYPYRGTSDGFAAFLRRRFSEADYLGIELEINQRIVTAGGRAWRTLRAAVVASLIDASGAIR